jgi:hypothetical protein
MRTRGRNETSADGSAQLSPSHGDFLSARLTGTISQHIHLRVFRAVTARTRRERGFKGYMSQVQLGLMSRDKRLL